MNWSLYFFINNARLWKICVDQTFETGSNFTYIVHTAKYKYPGPHGYTHIQVYQGWSWWGDRKGEW